jgi:hypothetical protein
MKVKTIKRHVAVFDESEVKLIYRALVNLEKQDYLTVNEERNQLKELKDSFYLLVKPSGIDVIRDIKP